ncbi:UBA domain-containing protein [Plantactinospora endophytica]|uniref:IrrE N-terminal-like domain-containing protein n=1 Tax=Plantactinospora endophytica TaxID=673535 RepID=A0ABQ4ECY9_9ACTN|nr:ImmA/IrrE family metallo-endopeptidase [Plantactinospora endophytica]GIG92146.1 hypothetical protein Pen02_70820 [Plantactinospora endophytica]
MILPVRQWKAAWRFRRLRRRCTARLAALRLPATASMETLCEQIGRQRNRPIRLLPMPLHEARPCGIWLALPDADLIVYEANTTRMHQDHIVAHELAHVVCGHSVLGDDRPFDPRQLFPDLDPGLVRTLLGRSHYSDAQEREAEVLASLLLSRVDRTPADHGDDDTALTIRLKAALLAPDNRGRRTDA